MSESMCVYVSVSLSLDVLGEDDRPLVSVCPSDSLLDDSALCLYLCVLCVYMSMSESMCVLCLCLCLSRRVG